MAEISNSRQLSTNQIAGKSEQRSKSFCQTTSSSCTTIFQKMSFSPECKSHGSMHSSCNGHNQALIEVSWDQTRGGGSRDQEPSLESFKARGLPGRWRHGVQTGCKVQGEELERFRHSSRRQSSRTQLYLLVPSVSLLRLCIRQRKTKFVQISLKVQRFDILPKQ